MRSRRPQGARTIREALESDCHQQGRHQCCPSLQRQRPSGTRPAAGLFFVLHRLRDVLKPPSTLPLPTTQKLFYPGHHKALAHEALIATYKDQQKVEGGFRFLKAPLFMASTLFLNSPKRIMVLIMVMTLSLLVYATLEHRIRERLQAVQPNLPQPERSTQQQSYRSLGVSVFHRDSCADDRAHSECVC